ncbi:MAG: hypothetical protein ACOC1T_02925, partial [Halorhodospira sp.]
TFDPSEVQKEFNTNREGKVQSTDYFYKGEVADMEAIREALSPLEQISGRLGAALGVRNPLDHVASRVNAFFETTKEKVSSFATALVDVNKMWEAFQQFSMDALSAFGRLMSRVYEVSVEFFNLALKSEPVQESMDRLSSTVEPLVDELGYMISEVIDATTEAAEGVIGQPSRDPQKIEDRVAKGVEAVIGDYQSPLYEDGMEVDDMADQVQGVVSNYDVDASTDDVEEALRAKGITDAMSEGSEEVEQVIRDVVDSFRPDEVGQQAEGLYRLVDSAQPVFDTLIQIIEDSVTPIFEGLGDILVSLEPIFDRVAKLASVFLRYIEWIASGLGPLAQVIDVVADVFEELMDQIDLFMAGLGAFVGAPWGAPGMVIGGGMGFGLGQFEKGGRQDEEGVALVGERGPELVKLPRGSWVHTAEETEQMRRKGELPEDLPAFASGGRMQDAPAGATGGSGSGLYKREQQASGSNAAQGMGNMGLMMVLGQFKDVIIGGAKHAGNALMWLGDKTWDLLPEAWTDAVESNADDAWDRVKDFAEDSWEEVRDFARDAWDRVASAFQEGLSGAWNTASSAAKSSWSAIQSAAVSSWDSITGFGSSAWDAITEFGSSAWDSVVSMASGAWSAIQAAGEATMAAIKGAGSAFSGGGGAAPAAAAGGGGGGLTSGLTGSLMGLGGGGLSGSLTSGGDPGAGTAIGTGVGTIFGGPVGGTAGGAFGGLLDQAYEEYDWSFSLDSGLDTLEDWGSSAWNKVSDWGSSAWDTVSDWGSSAADEVKSWFAKGGRTPDGRVLVGERGPELVDLPGGSWVHTADETRQMQRREGVAAFASGGRVAANDPAAAAEGVTILSRETKNGFRAMDDRIFEQSQGTEALSRGLSDMGRNVESGFQAINERFQSVDEGFQAFGERFKGVDGGFQKVGEHLGKVDEVLESHAEGIEKAMKKANKSDDTFFGFATGGRTPGSRVLVGENGPELVDLPKGSWVHTADETQQMMRSPAEAMPSLMEAAPSNGPMEDPSVLEDRGGGDEALLARLDEQNGKLERMLRAMAAKGQVDSEDAQALREELRLMRKRQRKAS